MPAAEIQSVTIRTFDDLLKAVMADTFTQQDIERLATASRTKLFALRRKEKNADAKTITITTYKHNELIFHLRKRGVDKDGNERRYWLIFSNNKGFENGKNTMSLGRDNVETRKNILNRYNLDVDEKIPNIPRLQLEEEVSPPAHYIFA